MHQGVQAVSRIWQGKKKSEVFPLRLQKEHGGVLYESQWVAL